MNAQAQGWDKVEVLVNRTEDGRLETDRSTLDRLSSINSPVHVVAAAGPYRTGKSHLLNVIIEALFGKTNVFPVGDTVQAQTKGISVWCHPHPSVKGHWIIFLDTEGLNDVEKGDRDNDILLFVLTILLSSTLVYNSCGVIDYKALETIHHVSVLAEKIRLMPDMGEDLEDFGFDLAFPELLWVVRDFQLNLEMNGTQITDDEYLESALSTSNMVLGPKKATVISVKRCIKEYFARRKCFLLPNLLRSANSSTTTAVSHQRDRTSHLIDQIAIGECKMHQGSEVTGRVLGRLAEELVEECQQRFHSQQPVNVQEVMERIAERENNAAVAKSLDLYRAEMNEKTEEAVEEVTLHQIHFNCSERATTNFMHVAVYPVDGGFVKLMDAIKLEFDLISQKNAAKINKLCDDTFKSLRKEIIGVNNTKYLCSGGFQTYREDMTELRKRWEQNPVLQGVGGRDFFNKMMCTLRENEAKLIMDADRSMTELRKQDALKQQQEERKRHEALKKQKDKSSETAVEHDRSAFEQRVTSQVRSAILRPHEAEISKLTCRIEVLDRELNGLRSRHSEDEVETYEQRIRNYQRMLSEKQNQPSKWQKVSSSIQSFARGTYDSIRRLFKLSNAADVKPCCVVTEETPDMSSSSPSMASPSRASSCGGPSSQSAAVSRAGPSARPVASMSAAAAGSSLGPRAASTASSGSSLGPRVSYSKASSGSSSAPPVSSSSAPPVSSSSTPPVSSSGSSSASSVSSSAPSSGSSSAVSSGSSSAVSSGSSSASSSGSSSASSGSASASPVSSTAAAAASISSSTPPAASSAPPSDSSLAPTASSAAAAAAASVSASASP